MMLQLCKYNLDVTHLPGKDIPVADTLSRNFLPDIYPHLSDGMDAQVHTVIKNTLISPTRLDEIKSKTEQDSKLSTLKHVILDG